MRSGSICATEFSVGAGAAWSAIPIAGNLEQEIADLFEAGEENQARAKMYEFLVGIQEPGTCILVGLPAKCR